MKLNKKFDQENNFGKQKLLNKEHWTYFFNDLLIIIIKIEKYNNMAELTPVWFFYFPLQTVQYVNLPPELEVQSLRKSLQVKNSLPQKNSDQKNEVFWKLFIKELQIVNQKYQKKIWQEKDDQNLIEMRENGLGWRQISKCIVGTNAQVCKRRFQKIKSQQKKWSKQIDLRIKDLYQVKGKSWKEIFSILNKEYKIQCKKQMRELKQRYRLYLCSSISKAVWDINEDLKLLELVQKQGRKWKKISKIFKDRTELQLKNRFYGSLLPIKRRVLKTLKQMEISLK